ncbi:SDR family NAD(P)-dependent oxidoreductase [Roseinatronobacter alkalisoli]|uniref:SDR family NAD(P)-dependent oxidoreductase n=1 Tax=Roseinatronobacter alkalisoli TaxID=3028235 RepID=A0ABT5T7K3_9RHOB|nr:SDR family oxidoreductase [Roseinatronobacter sp. HJB301]MDD7971034.1 SDR family NAD(P)-dependent oxidoreductase [Roseinatronobacter sp. HJB301]
MTKRALVTGTSSGIGHAIARDLLADGWHVTGLARRGPSFDSAAYSHVPVDLANADATQAAIAELPVPDALIHAAGLLRVGALADMDRADGARMWRLHVDCSAQLLQHFGPRMANGGRVVLLGSRVSTGAKEKALYAASKAALDGLARSVAAELAPQGVTVNIVAPAATDTPMLADPARASFSPALPPMGRLIDPTEVSGTVLFLLSPAAASMTGQRLVICAGASL